MKSFLHASTVEMTPDRDDYATWSPYEKQGERTAAKTVASSLKEMFKLKNQYPIIMNWKKGQKLEGTNTSNNNMDKDGSLIIHEGQVIRNHKYKEDKLPSR